MDQSLGTTKWSRNLSEDSQSESNRLRLIERQRQLLESKLQRQHQVIATTSRPSTGRTAKSALSGQRSTEKLIDLEDVGAGNETGGGVANAGQLKGDEYDYFCTIIRDKKGLDRSLYPTYYMHLQAIVPNTELEKSDKSSEQSSPKSSLELVNITNESSLNSNSNSSSNTSTDMIKGNDSGSRGPHTSSNIGGYRQVFILSGRRRKKSKTYIIGNDPFDISRGNCIAKLKSNVLGTQFTAIRFLSTNPYRNYII
ncbi:unnamed protein product [Oppiella nova]|uniref:Uncharacterized protein n=1 Tax=Oppiella nova TaxID=334625 RepID=A0A7R9M200_9ACAR|nr:unnamed protein product [Oppiella nova]CAG2169218.1 unnamed protein product [Oppiella nova]